MCLVVDKYKGKFPIKYTVSDNGCWLCVSHKPKTQRDGTKGYYSISKRVDGKKTTTTIHRVVYELYHRDIPKGLLVRHKCDNALCINPDHLELGTHQDNMDDMYSRNTSLYENRRGSKNANSKLSEEDVVAIRDDKVSTNQYLAEKYKVSHQLISKVRSGKIWTNV